MSNLLIAKISCILCENTYLPVSQMKLPASSAACAVVRSRAAGNKERIILSGIVVSSHSYGAVGRSVDASIFGVL